MYSTVGMESIQTLWNVLLFLKVNPSVEKNKQITHQSTNEDSPNPEFYANKKLKISITPFPGTLM